MRYHNITHDDMRNGDGLRVVLWVAGCGHCCNNCQNPITWDPEGGLPFDDAARQELYEQLSQDYISGVTFSGGDPLFPTNRTEIRKLCTEIKSRFPNKTIWLYTGYLWEEICNLPLIRDVDVLVDGEFVQELFDARLLWKGSANQRVIDVQKTLANGESGEVVLWCGDYS